MDQSEALPPVVLHRLVRHLCRIGRRQKSGRRGGRRGMPGTNSNRSASSSAWLTVSDTGARRTILLLCRTPGLTGRRKRNMTPDNTKPATPLPPVRSEPLLDAGSYFDRTDRIQRAGRTPTCPCCGKPMFPCDDHGRFTCFCQGLRATQF